MPKTGLQNAPACLWSKEFSKIKALTNFIPILLIANFAVILLNRHAKKFSERISARPFRIA